MTNQALVQCVQRWGEGTCSIISQAVKMYPHVAYRPTRRHTSNHPVTYSAFYVGLPDQETPDWSRQQLLMILIRSMNRHMNNANYWCLWIRRLSSCCFVVHVKGFKYIAFFKVLILYHYELKLAYSFVLQLSLLK